MNLKRTFQYYYIKFIRLKGDPKSLAKGTALGTFIGITPTIPFHTILVLIVTFLTRTSTIAALLASIIVSNPLLYVPQYFLSTIIGNAVTPYSFTWERIRVVVDVLLTRPGFTQSLNVLKDIGYEAVMVLLIGGSILAFPIAIGSYFLSLKLFIKIRKKRRKQHELTP